MQNTFLIDDERDLANPLPPVVVGKIAPDVLGKNLPEDCLYRPHDPLPPQKDRLLPEDAPTGLKELYNIAARDLRGMGYDPDKLYVYLLYQTGWVAPESCLRAGFWHFDLMRNLRAEVPPGKLAVSVGYGVSNCLPTIYTTRLVLPEGQDALPARETITDESRHDDLGNLAMKSGFIFRPRQGEVVRYDTLLLHRGAPNREAKPQHRVFMHIAFSAVP